MTGIVIKVSGVPLATAADEVDGLVPVPSQEQQKVVYPRASEAAFYDRGNVQTVLRFTVHREFKKIVDAFDFLAMLAANLTRQGTVELIFSEGASTVSRYLNNAIVTAQPQPLKGVSTFVTYTMTGGMISKTKE